MTSDRGGNMNHVVRRDSPYSHPIGHFLSLSLSGSGSSAEVYSPSNTLKMPVNLRQHSGYFNQGSVNVGTGTSGTWPGRRGRETYKLYQLHSSGWGSATSLRRLPVWCLLVYGKCHCSGDITFLQRAPNLCVTGVGRRTLFKFFWYTLTLSVPSIGSPSHHLHCHCQLSGLYKSPSHDLGICADSFRSPWRDSPLKVISTLRLMICYCFSALFGVAIN